ncbi:hypothetical protein C0J52_24707 [Blattella germanica]|nr:hypothetical protein C0J52_24707 [Blattella germanica]
MYGCEAWVMTEKNKTVGKMGTNSELTQLYKNPNIITLIKTKRLEWIGHVSRMDGGRSIKRSLKESLKE